MLRTKKLNTPIFIWVKGIHSKLKNSSICKLSRMDVRTITHLDPMVNIQQVPLHRKIKDVTATCGGFVTSYQLGTPPFIANFLCLRCLVVSTCGKHNRRTNFISRMINYLKSQTNPPVLKIKPSKPLPLVVLHVSDDINARVVIIAYRRIRVWNGDGK